MTYGHRDYEVEAPEDILATAGDVTTDFVSYYTDFHYWEIWILASWSVAEHFSAEILANYQPEKHTEKTDDQSVAFASLRLVWRP